MVTPIDQLIDGTLAAKDLYVAMTWSSGNYKNIRVCNFVNKHFYYCKPEILVGLLSLGIDKSYKFMRYPKAKKLNNERLDLIKPYVKKMFGWSNRVFERQKHIIDKFLDIAELNKLVGFSKKECTKLGLGFDTFKVEKPVDINNKSLFEKWN